jgi:hypothetical protein
MAERVWFIEFGRPVPGREEAAMTLGKKAIAMFERLQAAGIIEGFDAVMLDPHGGKLSSFMLVRGDAEKLARLPMDPEWQQLTVNTAAVADGFGIIGGSTGAAYVPMLEGFVAACTAATG